MRIEWTKRLYHREGFRRLGIVLACVASTAWVVFFARYFRRVYTAYDEFPVVDQGTPIDIVTNRLNQQIPTSLRGGALADRVVADEGFRKLTRNQQIVILEYLEGAFHSDRAEPIFLLAPPARVVRGHYQSDFAGEEIDVRNLPSGDHTTAEKELDARLGPDRAIPEQPTTPDIADEFAEQFTNTTVVDTVVRTHYVVNGFRLLVLVGYLVAGSIIAFAALVGVVAVVDWVVEGFKSGAG